MRAVQSILRVIGRHSKMPELPGFADPAKPVEIDQGLYDQPSNPLGRASLLR